MTCLILTFFFLFGATIIGRLIFIQIFNHQLYKALALGQQQFSVKVQGKRGEIFLKNKGNLIPMDINKTWPLCYAVPKEIKDKEGVAEKLANILNLNQGEVFEKINSVESLFSAIKSKLTKEEVEDLKELNLAGVYLGNEVLRYYPQGAFGSQLIGLYTVL